MDNWLCGFFEGQSSFAVNIGLNKSKNKRYVVFKPYIVVANSDKYQVNKLVKMLGINSSIGIKKKKEKYHNDYHSLNIQNFNDISKVVDRLKDYKFVSKIKQQKFNRFVNCFEFIQSIGHIHSSWDDVFEEVIDKKLSINDIRGNIDSNRFNKNAWVLRIKEHLEGEKE